MVKTDGEMRSANGDATKPYILKSTKVQFVKKSSYRIRYSDPDPSHKEEDLNSWLCRQCAAEGERPHGGCGLGATGPMMESLEKQGFRTQNLSLVTFPVQAIVTLCLDNSDI